MSHFSTRQCSASHGKGVTRLYPHCYYLSLACLIPRFVSNLAYLGSFGTEGWASHEFERTRGNVTANMERNVSRHHTELVCLNAPIVSHRAFGLERVQLSIKSSVLLPFSLK
ncbi:transposable element Tcb1 transposase [Trichonephila clavipes]|nr:transposable element Tcb1 transposase [Trichonephila clavipes]